MNLVIVIIISAFMLANVHTQVRQKLFPYNFGNNFALLNTPKNHQWNQFISGLCSKIQTTQGINQIIIHLFIMDKF